MTTDNVPELVARLRVPSPWNDFCTPACPDGDHDHPKSLFDLAADALESLHAEVESDTETIARVAMERDDARAALADRDAQLAEALARVLSVNIETPESGRALMYLVDDLTGTLSRSPRGAADRLKAEALEEEARGADEAWREWGDVNDASRRDNLQKRARELRARAEGETTQNGDPT